MIIEPIKCPSCGGKPESRSYFDYEKCVTFCRFHCTKCGKSTVTYSEIGPYGSNAFKQAQKDFANGIFINPRQD